MKIPSSEIVKLLHQRLPRECSAEDVEYAVLTIFSDKECGHTSRMDNTCHKPKGHDSWHSNGMVAWGDSAGKDTCPNCGQKKATHTCSTS